MKHAVVAGALVALLGTFALPATADDDAIKYRQAIFKAIGGHMTALVGIVRQEVPHGDDRAVHAAGMAGLAPLTHHIFPEGSGAGRTDALPAIWSDASGFADRRQAFIDAANGLNAVADGSMRDFVGAFQRLGQSCQGCHENYRAD